MHPSFSDIGSRIKVLKGIAPADSAAGTITGTGIDRTGFGSCVLHAHVGAASGSPDSFTVASKLQESDDDSTYTDVSGAAITTITADNGQAVKSIDLSGCKKFIRQVSTVAFVNGSTPKIEVAGVIVLGGATILPTSYS